MQKVEAIIRPQRLTDAIKALKEIGITGFTVNQVVGRGKQRDGRGVYRGHNYNVTLHPKVKLEIVVSDYNVEPVVQAIIQACKTGEDGDGKIYVCPVYQAFNIRTGLPDTSIDELADREAN
ncbi:P-II family nitrogen regulator [Ectobacillus ponti]|uniref:P-II family nitrogen regulator n=1 Tax=Ectobacillus ponti TaxID=2961894 RepID=A0AA41X436_9BACI|nr:P-II family nitrogen regulator [Ectobacillus ponti]MCP8968571.1 P-II family nitrogen regulator [Ectobacillus ponti]